MPNSRPATIEAARTERALERPDGSLEAVSKPVAEAAKLQTLPEFLRIQLRMMGFDTALLETTIP
jgi:hypothetical protein